MVLHDPLIVFINPRQPTNEKNLQLLDRDKLVTEAEAVWQMYLLRRALRPSNLLPPSYSPFVGPALYQGRTKACFPGFLMLLLHGDGQTDRRKLSAWGLVDHCWTE